MKKLILSTMLLALAMVAQAGDTKDCQGKAACCTKAKVSDQTKASCCTGTKTACKETPGKQALLSPKAAAEAGK